MDMFDNETLVSYGTKVRLVENLADKASGSVRDYDLKNIVDCSELCGLRDDFYGMDEVARNARNCLWKSLDDVIRLMKVSQADREVMDELWSLLERVDYSRSKIATAIQKVTNRIIELYEGLQVEYRTAEEEVARLNEYAAAFYEFGGKAPDKDGPAADLDGEEE